MINMMAAMVNIYVLIDLPLTGRTGVILCLRRLISRLLIVILLLVIIWLLVVIRLLVIRLLVIRLLVIDLRNYTRVWCSTPDAPIAVTITMPAYPLRAGSESLSR